MKFKFFTPYPLLFSLNTLRLRSDSKTFVCFELWLLLKLQIECYKLFKICSKNYPGFTPDFCGKLKSGSSPTFEIH